MKFRAFPFAAIVGVLLGFVLCSGAMAKRILNGGDVFERDARLANVIRVSDKTNTTVVKEDSIYYEDEHEGMSESDAYEIDSYDDLILLSVRVLMGFEPKDRYYKLTKNIEIAQVNSPEGWAMIGLSEKRPFTGHFDGNNKTITVTITGKAMSLFGFVKTARGYSIKDLNVKGSLVGDNAAGIVYDLISGTVQNCSFGGIVEGTRDEGVAGGIAAVMEGGELIGCSVLKGSLIKANTTVVGGIVGACAKGSVKNNYFFGTIEGSSRCKGGIIGISDSKVSVSGNEWTSIYPQQIGKITNNYDRK